jgi:hypothetical protein
VASPPACSRLPLQTQPIPIQSAPLIPLIQNIHIHDVMMRQIKLQSILLHKMKLAEKDGKGLQACTENGRGMLGPTGNMSGTMLQSLHKFTGHFSPMFSYVLVSQ